MRRAAFLFFLCMLSALVLAQTLSDPAIYRDKKFSQIVPVPPIEMGGPMWRRAEIRVIPLDLYLANKLELDSLQARVGKAQTDAARLEPLDPAARELLNRQQQLLKALLNFAQRQETNAGKGPTVLEVQRHLNEIQGKAMCEACHAAVIANHASVR